MSVLVAKSRIPAKTTLLSGAFKQDNDIKSTGDISSVSISFKIIELDSLYPLCELH